MPFNWYEQGLDKAHAGQIADITNHVLDSFSVVLEAGIEPGTPVVRGELEGTAKNPTTDDEAKNVIGVAIHVHKEPTTPYYEKGDTLPVMTLGDIFVQVDKAVKPDDAAGIIKKDNSYAFCAATLTSAIGITGAKFLDSAEDGELTRLRIRK